MSFNKWIVNKKSLLNIYNERGLGGIEARVKKTELIFTEDEFSEQVINSISNLILKFK